MVKVQRLFAKTNLKIQVCRTDKIPLGTKGRTSILSVESSASCGASFPVSRRKLLDRACFVTSFRQGGYPPCDACASIPCGLAVRKQHEMLFAASKFGKTNTENQTVWPKKNPPKAVWLFTLSALGGSYHIWRVCLFCCGIRRKSVEGTEVIIGDLRGVFFRRTSPLHL